MPGNLLIDFYLKDQPAGCCVSKVYALIFDKNHQALKDPGTGVRVLTAFVAAQQNTFAISLNEHAERTKYYYLNLDQTQFVLPANPKGEEYIIEFWRQTGAGVFSRSADTLEEVRRFRWSGSKIVDAELSDEGVDALATWEAHVSMTYDSETLTVYFMAHLEKNGELVTDSQQMTVLWLNKDGNTIANTSQTTYLPNADGVYEWDEPGIDLPPDQTSVIVCTIRDANGVDHVTVSYSNSWD